MTDSLTPEPPPAGAIPPDDPTRELSVARPDTDDSLVHLGVVGDTYTILLSGADTAGRYTLIDMHVPPGGGPPPHRHDFEEMFSILEGEIELTFRGETMVATAGVTVNIPANAPHVFRNASDRAARLLCLCSPSGQEDFFRAVGVADKPPALRTDRVVSPIMRCDGRVAPRRIRVLELRNQTMALQVLAGRQAAKLDERRVKVEQLRGTRTRRTRANARPGETPLRGASPRRSRPRLFRSKFASSSSAAG